MSDFLLRTATLEADEEESASAYWASTTFQARTHPNRPPFYATEVCRLIARLCPKTVLEFGCNAGRNLELLRCECDELSLAVPRSTGIDINTDSIEFGREKWGLDLQVGDRRLVASCADDAWDLTFTVSVLDHLPDAAALLNDLARVTGRWLILVEPHHQNLGRVESYQSSRAGEQGEVTPYSYVHDYDALLAGLDWVDVLNIPFPTGLARLGPLYRLRLLASSAEIAAT